VKSGLTVVAFLIGEPAVARRVELGDATVVDLSDGGELVDEAGGEDDSTLTLELDDGQLLLEVDGVPVDNRLGSLVLAREQLLRGQ